MHHQQTSQVSVELRMWVGRKYVRVVRDAKLARHWGDLWADTMRVAGIHTHVQTANRALQNHDLTSTCFTNLRRHVLS